MTNAWVIRAGRVGERDTWALQHGFSGGGWYEVWTSIFRVGELIVPTSG